MPHCKLDKKFLEIIINLLRDQNEQLLCTISENENISKKQLAALIPTKFELKQMIQNMD